MITFPLWSADIQTATSDGKKKTLCSHTHTRTKVRMSMSKKKISVVNAGMSHHMTEIPITSLFPADLFSHAPFASLQAFTCELISSYLTWKKERRRSSRGGLLRTSRQLVRIRHRDTEKEGRKNPVRKCLQNDARACRACARLVCGCSKVEALQEPEPSLVGGRRQEEGGGGEEEKKNHRLVASRLSA